MTSIIFFIQKIEEASKLLNGYCKAMLNSNFSNTLE